MLRRLKLQEAFAAVITGDDVAAAKPAPDIYRRAVAAAGAAPAQALVVEDSLPGVDAGLAAGAQVASVRTAVRRPHPRFVGAYADLFDLAGSLGAEVS